MQPTVNAFGLVITEPTTMVTDFMITALAAWLASRLLASGARDDSPARWSWGAAFGFIALGALFGGLSHGLAYYFEPAADAAIWKATVYTIGLSTLFSLGGTITGSPLSPRSRRWLQFANVAGFAWYAIWMIGHDDFVYVIYDYLPAMLAIAAIQVLAWMRERAPSAPWIVAGVAVTLLGAVVQQSGFALGPNFNHNDLYHVVQMLGIVLIYRGVSRLPARVLLNSGDQ